MNQDERTTILPVLPLDDAVVLPGTSVTFPVTSSEQAEALDGAVEGRILLVPRVEGTFASFGAVAQVVGEVTLPDGTRGVAVEAMHRAELGPAIVGEAGLRVSARELPDPDDPGPEAAAPGARVPRRGRGGRRPPWRPRPRRALPRHHRPPRPAGRHGRLRAGDPPGHQARAARDVRRRRPPAPGHRGPARAPGRRRPAPAHPRGRGRGPRQDPARDAAAPPARRDPQGARRGRRGRRRRLGGAHRGRQHARGRPQGGRARARPPASGSPRAPRPG